MHYAVVDIGSPRQGNLGWWITGPFIEEGGTGPEDLMANLAEAVKAGPVILGYSFSCSGHIKTLLPNHGFQRT